MTLWWLSFADENGFRGGINVEAESFPEAVIKTHQLGINPGGEVMGFNMPPDFTLPDKWLNRCLSTAEISQMGQEVAGDPSLTRFGADGSTEEFTPQ